MDIQNPKKPLVCQWKHPSGDCDIFSICTNPECKIRLVCTLCYSDKYHASHATKCIPITQLKFKLSRVITQTQIMNLQLVVNQKEKEFKSIRDAFLLHLQQFELEFYKELQQYKSLQDNFQIAMEIFESSQTNNLTEKVAQTISDLYNNPIDDVINNIHLKLIQQKINIYQQMDTNLYNKLQIVNTDKFLRMNISSDRIRNFYSLNYLNYYQSPQNTISIKGEPQKEITLSDNDSIYLGEKRFDKKHGKGILINKQDQTIIEGIWKDDSIFWGQKCFLLNNQYFIGTGHFNKGKLQGFGYLLGEDQTQLEGIFIDGQMTGEVIIRKKDGSIQTAEIKNEQNVIIQNSVNQEGPTNNIYSQTVVHQTSQFTTSKRFLLSLRPRQLSRSNNFTYSQE